MSTSVIDTLSQAPAGVSQDAIHILIGFVLVILGVIAGFVMQKNRSTKN